MREAENGGGLSDIDVDDKIVHSEPAAPEQCSAGSGTSVRDDFPFQVKTPLTAVRPNG